MKKSSRISGFYKLQRGERLDALRDFCDLPVDQARILTKDGSLTFETTDLFVENAIGSHPLPLGLATSFHINGEDYLIPMAVEESSVIAAASNAARIVYESGGFQAEIRSHLMIGQIQLLDIPREKFPEMIAKIEAQKTTLLHMANEIHPRLIMRGGGAREIEVRSFPEARKPFLVVHVLLDPKDAMGANLINTVCEGLAPYLEEVTGARAGLQILSNLADRRLVKARCVVKKEKLQFRDPGLGYKAEDITQKMFEAYEFAATDPYRAATHNKGIMNGIDPVVIATGNDWRAVEAGAHAYAARSGHYTSLSKWSLTKDNDLVGELELPMQLGTVGGVTRLHPTARIALQILGNPNAQELAKIICCSGLASNLAAMRALCTTGIQRGHMKLHAKNLALAAGAVGKEIEVVSQEMLKAKEVSASQAESILTKLRAGQKESSPKRENSVSSTS